MSIDRILRGINKQEEDDGWWETSTGAEFGAEKLTEVNAYVAELKRDAERYRWLRLEHDRIDPVMRCSYKMFGQRTSGNWGNIIDSAELDQLIDKEISNG